MPEAMAQSLHLIRQRFVEGLPQRVETLDMLVTRIELGHMADEALSEVAQEMHRIAGVAKTLGFPELGQLARDTETDLIAVKGHQLDDNLKAQIADRIDYTVNVIAQTMDAELG